MIKKEPRPIEYSEVSYCDSCGHACNLERENRDKSIGLCSFCIEGMFASFFEKPRKIEPLYPLCSVYDCKKQLTRKDIDESDYSLMCKECRDEQEERRRVPQKEEHFSVYKLPGKEHI